MSYEPPGYISNGMTATAIVHLKRDQTELLVCFSCLVYYDRALRRRIPALPGKEKSYG